MNELIVDVKLWGKSVGSLYWEKETEAAVFDFERKFLRSGLDIAPQLSLNGKQDNFTYEDIVTVAENMGIRNCKHIIGQIGETVSHWKDYAKEGGVNERHSQTINDHLLVLAPK